MKSRYLLLFLAMPLYGEECSGNGYPEEGYTVIEESQEFKPLQRYYPYCSIYHDSVVREQLSEPDPSWPSRDETFSDLFNN